MNTPYYLLDEGLLRANLSVIAEVAKRAGVEVILAFKAYALWKTFDIFREYIGATTASSPFEARLALEAFGTRAHTYSPAYKGEDVGVIARCSSHVTFNSLSQYGRFHDAMTAVEPTLAFGLRINPEYSEVDTLLYNPCAPGTRFGVTADKLPARLPDDISGFHCHCHCESGADVFERTLAHIEGRFSSWFDQIDWINFGGGHLMTRADYDIELLVSTLRAFHARYPHLHIILEPGSAFAWRTGDLVASVVDIVEDKGISTAILDVSFTCHMPDCLEMPYHPAVRGAVTRPALGDGCLPTDELPAHTYRLGGNSCLSGDYMGFWTFDHVLEVGEKVVFEDMLHYTTVKTTMFNGIAHPAIALRHCDGSIEVLREYDYADYKSRMD